jgi:hypothetical protein
MVGAIMHEVPATSSQSCLYWNCGWDLVVASGIAANDMNNDNRIWKEVVSLKGFTGSWGILHMYMHAPSIVLS